MRGFILGILMLMAVPEYVVGQQRHRSGRSATGRTAVPREEAVQPAPARQTDRRAERRGDTNKPAPREEKSDDAAPSRAGRERRSTPNVPETVRGRMRDARLQAAQARAYPTISPRIPEVHRQSPRTIPVFGRFPIASIGDRARTRLPTTLSTPAQRSERRVRSICCAVRSRARSRGRARNIVDEAAGAPVIVEQPLPARLILDIHPPTAQVFADGYYIGIPEDFRFEDGGAVLEPGPHRIDILARDYEPVTFDVNLTRGQSATFRPTLTPTMSAPQPAPDDAVKAPPAVKQPATFYLIPGCYMGNVPPKDANLPATCDIARAVSVQVLIELSGV